LAAEEISDQQNVISLKTTEPRSNEAMQVYQDA
jgi:hypothetical protein